MTLLLASTAPVTMNPFAWLAFLIGPAGFVWLCWRARRPSRASLRRRFRAVEEDELVNAHRRIVREALDHPRE